jgi:hypothetical protein
MVDWAEVAKKSSHQLSRFGCQRSFDRGAVRQTNARNQGSSSLIVSVGIDDSSTAAACFTWNL